MPGFGARRIVFFALVAFRFTLATPSAAAPATVPTYRPVTTLKAMPGGLQITGTPGERYRVMATLDFKTWEPIANLESTSGTVEFIDLEAINFARRFYRLEMLTDAQWRKQDADPIGNVPKFGGRFTGL